MGKPRSDDLRLMASALRHRGPDDSGLWMDADVGIGLAHTRLAIQDLTSAGHQPMLSLSQRMVLVFNGEIYNHLELREKIQNQAGEALRWRGHSDTETLLAGFEIWGIEQTIRLCVGMFAFAVWDREKRTLILARDRLGEKPLYYGSNAGTFFFASDLRGIKAHPGFRSEIDQGALADYLRYGYIPAPNSIYCGIHKLLPGSIVTVSASFRELPLPRRYWSLTEVAESGRRLPFSGSREEALDALHGHLTASVRGQKLSDVPLGSFLSGGIDSSLVTALLQENSTQPVHTFTIGFEEESHNEAGQAKTVAKILGTSHNELYLTSSNVCDLIPKLASIHSEPFCDPSQLPTFLLSRFAGQSVTVSLSGDGGDEFFCGYERYRMFSRISMFPKAIRGAVATLLNALSVSNWDRVSGIISNSMGRRGIPFAGDKAHKVARILRADSMDAMYLNFLSIWPPEDTITAHHPFSDFPKALKELSTLSDLQSRLMAFDAMTYLPDDVLCKVDRAAMAVSLETRAPLLDHRLVEFAWTLPLSLNRQTDGGKQLLKQLLSRYLPAELINRPKKGFAVPIASWLRGPLREWAEDILNTKKLEASGVVNPEIVRLKWEQHIRGERNWHYQLWNVLMLQAWMRHERFI